MKQKGFLYIILSGLLWGTSGIFVSVLAPLGFSTIQMTAVRAFVSLIIIGSYVFYCDKTLFKIKLSELPLYIITGLSMLLTSFCYFTSMQKTSVSTSVMLMYTAPIFVMIYSVCFLKEKLTITKIISVIAMFLGCGLISGIIGGLKYNLSGIIIGLLSGITYSLYNIVTKIEMLKKINPIKAVLYCYVFMAVFSFIITPPADIFLTALENPVKNIPLLFGLGIITSTLPYFLYTLGLKAMPAGIVSSLSVIEPLAATIYSVLFFKEKLGVYNIIGIVLIVGAAILLNREAEEENADKSV